VRASEVRKTISGNQPTVIGPSATLAVSRAPSFSDRLSAENPSSREF